MKKYSIAVLFFLTFAGADAFGQVYEKIYTTAPLAIQQRMDQNKMAGVDILSGVQTHHIIGISGLSGSQRTQLEGILNAETVIKSFTINADMTSVEINSGAWFTKDKFAELLHQLNGVVTGYSAEYTLNEQ